MKQQLLNAQKLFNDKNRGFRVNSESDLYDIIVHQLPSQIKTMVSSDEYRVKGSIGQGNITTHPWISILNTDITATTQEGLYVVLLFNSSFDAFYVSLNQGITYFKNKYRSKRYEYALQMAQYYRQELGERSGISYAPIDLKASKRSLAYGYEKTNIASKRFEINNLDLQELENTIHKFVDMYDEIVQHMPLGSSYDDVVYSVLFSEADAYVNADDAIKSIKNVISKEVRIPSGVKQRLVLMTAGKERTQKFKKLSSPITKKTDWIGKAREDAITGLSGECLILQYEQERLRKLGLLDQAEKIKHLSVVSDGYGYDIKSFDIDVNGHTHDLFIEVKTTTLGYDSEFFVSRNELNKSRLLKDNFAIYRIYNCNDINPKFYVAKGSIENNFFLDPITYSAKYKYLLK